MRSRGAKVVTQSGWRESHRTFPAHRAVRCVVALVLVFSSLHPAGANFVGFKSPGPGMHFTAGKPLRIFADVFDDASLSPLAECFLDGSSQGVVQGQDNPRDFYQWWVPVSAPGTHNVRIHASFTGGSTQDASMDIIVDPMSVVGSTLRPGAPAIQTIIDLTADQSGPVAWSNAIVNGNGHAVTAVGSLSIKNCFVTGLGSLTTDGIVGSSLTSVDIEDSIFEDTGELNLSLASGADAKFLNNEFRANDRIPIEAGAGNESGIYPHIRISFGGAAGRKIFQGNRVGAGSVFFLHSPNWLVGGDTDAQGNIFMGPRGGLTIAGDGSAGFTVRGNYSHHNYRQQWTEGENFDFTSSGGGHLIEHNLIRGGSWPERGMSGEFRYNLCVGFGHSWLQDTVNGTRIHHNLLVPENLPGDEGSGAGITFLYAESALQIYNNTLDAGGAAAGNFPGPFVYIKGDVSVSSLRNNLFTFGVSNGPHVFADVNDAGTTRGTFLSVDYNAFYSPDAGTANNYDIVVPGRTEGSDGFGGHDVSQTSSGQGVVGVVNGRLMVSPFAGARNMPYDTADGGFVDEGLVWQRLQRLSSILAAFRAAYMPTASTPIVDAGDPQDTDALGRRADIGAIDRGGHSADQFGRFGDEIFHDGFEGR